MDTNEATRLGHEDAHAIIRDANQLSLDLAPGERRIIADGSAYSPSWRVLTNGAKIWDAKKCSDGLRKAERARRREQRRREREQERQAVEARKRERERQQLERFKARVRARRGESFTTIAREAAGSLASLAQHLDAPTDELESCDV